MTKYYDEKLKQGQEYQDFVVSELYKIGIPVITYTSKKYQIGEGENKAGFEIKFDDRFKKTGNLYIEIAEKADPNNPNFIPSGIYCRDNAWLYVIGDYQSIYIFPKELLKQLHATGIYKEVKIETSRGYLLPKKDAEEFSIKKLFLKNRK